MFKCVFRLLLSLLVTWSSFLLGASGSWIIDADGDWNVDGNWSGATFPNGATELASLGGVITAPRVISLDSGGAQNITIDTLNAISGFTYTVQSGFPGNTLTVDDSGGAGGLILDSTTISCPTILTGNSSVFKNGNGQAVISGSIALKPVATTQFVISNGTATSDMVITGPIISGAELDKRGAGRLELAGTVSNAHNSTVVRDGELLLNKSGGAVAAPNGLGISGPGTAIVVDGNQVVGNIAMNGSFGVARLRSTTTFTLSNPTSLLLNTEIETNGGTTLTHNGVISGTGNLAKTGAGTLVLGGANNYSGGTTVSTGILQGTTTSLQGPITNNSAVVFNQGVAGTYSGNLSGTGTLTKSGAGTVVLSGVNSYSGGTTVSAGTLQGTTTSLQGPITNNSAVVFNQGVGGTYSGNLSGTGTLTKSGAGTVVLSGVNSYSGGTTVSAGTLQGTTTSLQGPITNNSAVIFNQGFDGTYGGSLSGAGTLTKSGTGIATFSGNSAGFTGPTTIGAGSLSVTGDLSGSSLITVSPGAFLEGTGTVGSVLNNGTTSPGTSIGTLTVFGTFTQGPGGTFLVEIDDMGNSDLLIVAGVPGTANLDGIVLLTPLPGLYNAGTVYTILQANTINGQFAQLLENHPLDFFLTHLPNSVLLTISAQTAILPVSLNALSGNAKKIGEYIFSCGATFSPAIVPILETLLHLPADEFVETLLQFGPQNSGALGLTRMQTNTSISHSMNQASDGYQRFLNDNRACNDSSSIWVEPIGYYYKQNEMEQQTPFNDRTYGLTLGYKQTFFNHLLVTIGGGYSHSNLNWYWNQGDATIQSIYLAPGVGYVGEWGYAGLVVQGARSFYNVDRKIQFSTTDTIPFDNHVKETAHNEHKGWDILTGFQGGVKVPIPEAFTSNFFIVPSVNLDYLNVFEGGYQESGAGPINLSVKNQHSAYLRSEVILRFLKELTKGPFLCFPNVFIGWLKNVPLTNGHYSSRFYKQNLCGKHFSTQSYHRSTNQLILGAEIETICFSNISLKLAYKANIGNHYNVQEGSLKANWAF